MKYKAFILIFISLLFVGCNVRTEFKVVYKEHYENDSYTVPSNIMTYDSVIFNDGSYAVYKLQRAPMNEDLVVYDNAGRKLLTSSRASECSTEQMLFHYDKRGRLTQLITTSDEYYGTPNYEAVYEKIFKYCNHGETLDSLRNKIVDIDWENIDTTIFDRYNFNYDKNNNLVEVSLVEVEDHFDHSKDSYDKSYNYKNIEAPVGYKIRLQIEPCVNFWASDIAGGIYDIKCDIIPINIDSDNVLVKRYVNCELVYEYLYKNKESVTLINHYRSITPGVGRKTMTKRISNEDTIYSLVSDTDTTKFIWHNGHLEYIQKVSSYGTILSQDSYFYEDDMVEISYEVIDYKNKQLHNIGQEYISYDELITEKEMWEIYLIREEDLYSPEDMNPDNFKKLLWQ